MEIKIDNEVIEKLKEKIKKDFKTIITKETILQPINNQADEE